MLEDKYNEYVNIETGEVKEGVLISKEEIEKQKESRKRKEKFLENKRKYNEFSFMVNDYFGNFYFNNYANLLYKLSNNPAALFRFLYLCTYVDYDGFLKNDNKTFIKYKDFQKLFNLGRTATYEMKNTLRINQMIEQVGDKIMINSDYCVRGQLKTSDRKSSIRVFDDAIRELYENSLPKEHKRIGYLILLLPYLNRYRNVVCKNPYEKDPNKIKLLTMDEICKIINYDINQISRLERDLIKTTVNGTPTVAVFKHTNTVEFMINPSVFYAGDDIEDVKFLTDLFKINSK